MDTGTGIAEHVADGVLTLVLDRPARLNAVDTTMFATLADRVEAAADLPGVRVVVVTGAGGAFCSGADLSADPASHDGTLREAGRLVHAVTACPLPVLAGIDGPAVGIGCSIALACDVVVATERSYFSLPFTEIALMPDGGATLTVPAAVGRARAMDMALLPQRLPATAARRDGLIARVVPDGTLAAELTRLAARLVATPAAALAATKRAVNAATLPALGAALDRETAGQTGLLGSADLAEAIAAFRERRAPRYPAG